MAVHAELHTYILVTCQHVGEGGGGGARHSMQLAVGKVTSFMEGDQAATANHLGGRDPKKE